jgi:hypothetical protein
VLFYGKSAVVKPGDLLNEFHFSGGGGNGFFQSCRSTVPCEIVQTAHGFIQSGGEPLAERFFLLSAPSADAVIVGRRPENIRGKEISGELSAILPKRDIAILPVDDQLEISAVESEFFSGNTDGYRRRAGGFFLCWEK